MVRVIEYFEHEGVPFIAMEYLERGSLRPLVGQLTLAQVAGVLDSVLGGLAEAAAQGIVHRDLKPENVLVTADGHAKVADFGIAKAIGQVCMTDFRTATGQIVGTPAYMAPEQITGGEITPQVDLYATGLLAYELLAGRHPFHGTDAPMALLMHHVNDEPAAARERPPGPPARCRRVGPRDDRQGPGGAARRRGGGLGPAGGRRVRRPRAALAPRRGDPEPAAQPPDGGRARAAERAVRDLLGRRAAPADAIAEPPRVRTRAGRAGAIRARIPVPVRPPMHAQPVPGTRLPSRRGPRRTGPPARAVCAGASSCSPWPARCSSRSRRSCTRLRPARSRAARRQRRPGRRSSSGSATPSTPAVRAEGRVSRELSSLVPGAGPDDALDRVGAAIAATGRRAPRCAGSA